MCLFCSVISGRKSMLKVPMNHSICNAPRRPLTMVRLIKWSQKLKTTWPKKNAKFNSFRWLRNHRWFTPNSKRKGNENEKPPLYFMVSLGKFDPFLMNDMNIDINDLFLVLTLGTFTFGNPLLCCKEAHMWELQPRAVCSADKQPLPNTGTFHLPAEAPDIVKQKWQKLSPNTLSEFLTCRKYVIQ